MLGDILVILKRLLKIVLLYTEVLTMWLYVQMLRIARLIS